jgi:hypothetical protein
LTAEALKTLVSHTVYQIQKLPFWAEDAEIDSDYFLITLGMLNLKVYLGLKDTRVKVAPGFNLRTEKTKLRNFVNEVSSNDQKLMPALLKYHSMGESKSELEHHQNKLMEDIEDALYYLKNQNSVSEASGVLIDKCGGDIRKIGDVDKAQTALEYFTEVYTSNKTAIGGDEASDQVRVIPEPLKEQTLSEHVMSQTLDSVASITEIKVTGKQMPTINHEAGPKMSILIPDVVIPDTTKADTDEKKKLLTELANSSHRDIMKKIHSQQTAGSDFTRILISEMLDSYWMYDHVTESLVSNFPKSVVDVPRISKGRLPASFIREMKASRANLITSTPMSVYQAFVPTVIVNNAQTEALRATLELELIKVLANMHTRFSASVVLNFEKMGEFPYTDDDAVRYLNSVIDTNLTRVCDLDDFSRVSQNTKVSLSVSVMNSFYRNREGLKRLMYFYFSTMQAEVKVMVYGAHMLQSDDDKTNLMLLFASLDVLLETLIDTDIEKFIFRLGMPENVKSVDRLGKLKRIIPNSIENFKPEYYSTDGYDENLSLYKSKRTQMPPALRPGGPKMDEAPAYYKFFNVDATAADLGINLGKSFEDTTNLPNGMNFSVVLDHEEFQIDAAGITEDTMGATKLVELARKYAGSHKCYRHIADFDQDASYFIAPFRMERIAYLQVTGGSYFSNAVNLAGYFGETKLERNHLDRVLMLIINIEQIIGCHLFAAVAHSKFSLMSLKEIFNTAFKLCVYAQMFLTENSRYDLFVLNNLTQFAGQFKSFSVVYNYFISLIGAVATYRSDLPELKIKESARIKTVSPKFVSTLDCLSEACAIIYGENGDVSQDRDKIAMAVIRRNSADLMPWLAVWLPDMPESYAAAEKEMMISKKKTCRIESNTILSCFRDPGDFNKVNSSKVKYFSTFRSALNKVVTVFSYFN